MSNKAVSVFGIKMGEPLKTEAKRKPRTNHTRKSTPTYKKNELYEAQGDYYRIYRSTFCKILRTLEDGKVEIQRGFPEGMTSVVSAKELSIPSDTQFIWYADGSL